MIVVPKTRLRQSFVEPKPAWGIDSSGVIFVRCGDCGRCIGLDHEIDKEGNVTPSVFHDDPKCGWHVHIKLEGWKNE